jgi:hypothetical protein
MELEWKYLDELYREKYFDKVVPPVYLKSEADKVIAYHKYKRCLAMARWCASRSASWCLDPADEQLHKSEFYDKWKHRWLEIAEKFKEAK